MRGKPRDDGHLRVSAPVLSIPIWRDVLEGAFVDGPSFSKFLFPSASLLCDIPTIRCPAQGLQELAFTASQV